MPENIYRNQIEIVTPQYISQGKTLPGIALLFKDGETQAAVDLSEATITLSWKRFDADLDSWYELTAENSPVGDVDGNLTYAFSENDTVVTGIHFAQFEIEYADGSSEVVPSLDGIQINIV